MHPSLIFRRPPEHIKPLWLIIISKLLGTSVYADSMTHFFDHDSYRRPSSSIFATSGKWLCTSPDWLLHNFQPIRAQKNNQISTTCKYSLLEIPHSALKIPSIISSMDGSPSSY
ncbi:hypothetical protein B0H19DRAFT_167002 [Mycena capillaripes]|nr:hypothetical protein B0H19DRAFT_167002 [Mycena capillaripes]